MAYQAIPLPMCSLELTAKLIPDSLTVARSRLIRDDRRGTRHGHMQEG